MLTFERIAGAGVGAGAAEEDESLGGDDRVEKFACADTMTFELEGIVLGVVKAEALLKMVDVGFAGVMGITGAAAVGTVGTGGATAPLSLSMRADLRR